jgi:hypothetical protein
VTKMCLAMYYKCLPGIRRRDYEAVKAEIQAFIIA